MASRRGTGGVDDCGTAEEDGPVTWETPDCPVGRSGRRRTGDPLRRAVGCKRSDGRPRGGKATGHRTNACSTGKAGPRASCVRWLTCWRGTSRSPITRRFYGAGCQHALLEQIDDPVASVSADRAYDATGVYGAAQMKGDGKAVRVLILPVQGDHRSTNEESHPGGPTRGGAARVQDPQYDDQAWDAGQLPNGVIPAWGGGSVLISEPCTNATENWRDFGPRSH